MSPTRYAETVGGRGMVSSAHYLASQAGVWVLRTGGNAVDAAVCAAATIAVVAPNLNGVGGDLFAQVWPPGAASPAGLNASGRSGSLASMDGVRDRGHGGMPVRGPLSINVPGAVSGWQALLERFGTRRLYDVLEPAIEYAEHGAPVTATIAAALSASRSFLYENAGFRAVFTRNGRPLEEGETFVNTELAGSLKEIAASDGESLYRGSLGDNLASALAAAGTFITRDDLARHGAVWIDPVSTRFLGATVWELPPNTQGLAALEMLNLAQRSGAHRLGHNQAPYIDGLCHVVALAIEDRDRHVTDPGFSTAPVEKLTSIQYAAERLGDRVSRPRDASDADTIYLCCIDGDGLAVSLIQSQFRGFGSGVMAQGTGIHLNNRGSYFSLDPTHINRLEPRKLTMHTLIPGMASLPNGDLFIFGTMGGDAQPQIHLQILLNLLQFDMGVQAAIESPRFIWSPEGGSPARVLLEARIGGDIARELARLGRDPASVEGWSSQMGHAQAIRLDRQSGRLYGGADPRGDGAAIGY